MIKKFDQQLLALKGVDYWIGLVQEVQKFPSRDDQQKLLKINKLFYTFI